jgi:glycosyltransferase involved in cell wall biosynthesis
MTEENAGKQINIVMFTPYFPPFWEYGGPVRSIDGLMRILAEYGSRLHIITTYYKEDEDALNCKIEFPKNCRVDYLKINAKKGSFLGRFFLALSVLSVGLKRVRKSDVIYVNGLWSWPSLVGTLLAFLFKRRLVLSPRGMLMPSAMQFNYRVKRGLLVFYRFVLKRTDICIHWTTHAEKKISVPLGLASSQEQVIPNVIYEQSFWSNPLSLTRPQPLSLLYLGRLHPIKNLEVILKAIAQVVSEGHCVEFKILGGGSEDYSKKLNDLVRKLRIEHVTQFLEPDNSSERIKIIDSCHIGILVSKSENFGVAAAEFLARGRPVIVGRGVAIAEFLQGSSAAWVVDPEPVNVRNALIEIIATMDKSGKPEAMSNEARQLAEQCFAPQTQVKPFLDLFGCAEQ